MTTEHPTTTFIATHWGSDVDEDGFLIIKLGNDTDMHMKIKLDPLQARMLAHKMLKDLDQFSK